MSAEPNIAAIDLHDHGDVQCWCCDTADTPDRMVQLGNHPEVHLCLQCAHYVHQRAWVIEDEGSKGPGAFVRDRFRNLRAAVRRHGWQPSRFTGGTALARQGLPVKIELMVVPDCPHEAAAAELITTAVAGTGVDATITHTIIATEHQARQRGFTGSPRILVDGSDPFDRHAEPVALSCRLFWTPQGPRGVPALRDLRQALNRVAAG